MPEFAKSIQEALDLLKGGSPEGQEEPTHEEEPQAGEASADDSMEKGEINLDLVPSQDDNEIVEMVKADGFMTSLMQNQDYNFSQLEKGILSNTRAVSQICTVLKAFDEKFSEFGEMIKGIAGAPQPQKGALSREEAENLSKGIVTGNKGEEPTPDISKASVVSALVQGHSSGVVPEEDILKAESALSAYDRVPANLLDIFSVQGQAHLKSAFKLS